MLTGTTMCLQEQEVLTCAGLAADPLAADPSAGGAHHHAVLPARGEPVEAVLGASVRLRGVGHQLPPPVQHLQAVTVGNAQGLLPGDLQAAGGLLAVHLKPRHGGGHWGDGRGGEHTLGLGRDPVGWRWDKGVTNFRVIAPLLPGVCVCV